VTSESVESHFGIRFVSISNTQRKSQVIAECVQITFRLLNLGELLSAAGLDIGVDRERVGGSTTDEIRKIRKLQIRAGRLR
jgi:hypothetical protein